MGSLNNRELSIVYASDDRFAEILGGSRFWVFSDCTFLDNSSLELYLNSGACFT